MVYVDNWNELFNFNRCNMMSDKIEELHMMAQKINLDKKHYKPRKYPHYLISLEQKEKAIKNGALKKGFRAIVTHLKNIKAEGWSDD